MRYMLGKQPAIRKDSDLLFANYRNKIALPTPPAEFGHEMVIAQKAWGMLGNNEVGCCVFSGADHEHMMWERVAKMSPLPCFTTKDCIADYSAVTGYIPGQPNTDNGTNVQTAMEFRRTVGMQDNKGHRHKIGAALALNIKNFQEIWEALYLFEVVGLGIQVPASAQDQFSAGQPWTVVKGSPIEGGHYVPLVARRAMPVVVTWGQTQLAALTFLSKYLDEAWAILSTEDLVNGKSPEGFDYATLQADLKAL